jgi:hypothetical protein
MIRLTSIAIILGLLGCGQREQPSAVIVAPVVATESSIADLQTSQVPEPKTVSTPKAPEPPPAFEYPTDLTGPVVMRAITPELPASPSIERFGIAPLARTAPAKILNPEATVKANYTPPTIMPVLSSGVKIAPPRETVPFDLGRGADSTPGRPSLPISAAITERARDVNLPPAMPTLGRPLTERVSLDDPTSEFGNIAIVAPSVNVPLASADFMKVTLPDPFELGEQVKPKIPPTAEPGMTPAVVNPSRVK